MSQPPWPPYPAQPPYGYVPAPAWPPTPPDPRRAAHPHPEPRPFDEMLRTWDYAWWRCLVGVLTLLAGVMIVMPILLLPVLAIAVALEGPPDFLDALFDAATAQKVTPASMLYLNLALASAILVTWFIVRVFHNLRPRWLSSVRPRIRWRFLAACIAVAVAAVLTQLVVSLFLPAATEEPLGDPNPITGKLVALGLVILFTTPLQAAGEEYAFRGYLQQAFGSVAGALADRGGVRRRVANVVVHGVAILVPALLFAIAHGAQNWPLFLDRLLFGIGAGYVALRTGGLEAGIAMHVVNNLVAFGIPLFYADIDSALEVTEVSWWQLPLSASQTLVFAVLALLMARWMRVGTRTTPPVLVDGTPTR